MDLNPFVNLIKNKCGLFFEGDRLSSLASGIQNRMSEKGLESHAEYFNELTGSESEFIHLVNLLTINETYFLREPRHFRILSDMLIPKIFQKKKSGERVKILSAGCSTGEEPYSIVMSLMNKYGMGSEAISSVIAVDIDAEAVSAAKKGVFGRNSFRKFDDTLKKRYFKPVSDGINQGGAGDAGYMILDTVKQSVEFKNFNLLSDFYPNTLQGIDIIFYRNVSIYFDPESQRKIFHKLSQILSEGGYLFVSSSETLFHNIGILSLVEIDGVFLYHKGVEVKIEERRKKNLINHRDTEAQRKDKLNKPLCLRASVADLNNTLEKPIHQAAGSDFSEKREDSRLLFDEALHLAKDKKYNKALSRINKLMEDNPPFTKSYALKASILINLGQLEEAKKACLKIIQIDNWHLEGYLLMGLIAKIEDNGEEVVKRFKEALYIQPSCWLAHFYLAEAYHARGEQEQACREYGIVIGLLENGKVSDHGLTYFPISFPAEQLAHLCRHNLKKIGSGVKGQGSR